MTEPTTTPIVNAAAKKAGVAAAAISETIPTVIETVEVAVEVPAKVVLNQKLVVAVSILGGAALGAGILFGVNKWRNRNKVTVEFPDSYDSSQSHDETDENSSL